VMREVANQYEELANIAGKEMYRARLGKNMASTYIFNKWDSLSSPSCY